MSTSSPAAAFPSTHWTVVGRIKSADGAVAAKALNEICKHYHYPLYCYLRRRGCSHHDAEDVLHEFLAGLCRLHTLERMEQERGRLRGFLATSLGRFLQRWRQGEIRRARPACELNSLPDFDRIEHRYLREHFTDTDTPERIFERKWAAEILNRVLETLSVRYAEKGRTAIYAALRPVLLRGGSLRGEDSPAIAAHLGVSEGALRTALSRLLREFRHELKSVIGFTVGHDGEVADELAYLRGLFQR